MLTINMITETEVLQAYQKQLALVVRQMEIEVSREETPEEADERLQAVCDHTELELKYIAQFTGEVIDDWDDF